MRLYFNFLNPFIDEADPHQFTFGSKLIQFNLNDNIL